MNETQMARQLTLEGYTPDEVEDLTSSWAEDEGDARRDRDALEAHPPLTEGTV